MRSNMGSRLEAVVGYREHLLAKGFSAGTVEIYTGHVRRFFTWLEDTCGSADIAAVTPLDIADYRRYLQGKGKKPAFINHNLIVFSGFFGWAQKHGLVEANPTDGVKRIPERKPAPRWLEKKELGAFMRAVQK